MEKKVVNAVVKAGDVMGRCSNVLNKSLKDMLDIICKEHKGEEVLAIDVTRDSYPVADTVSEEVAVGLITKVCINVEKKKLTCLCIKTPNYATNVYWEDLDLDSKYNVILAIYDAYFKNGEK